MRVFSSLTNRIFVASALLAVLAIGVAVYRVNVAVTQQAENELRRGIEEAGRLVEEYRTTLFEHYSREARLVADLPRFKAAMTGLDPRTVQPIAEDYQRQLGSDAFVVTDPAGRILAQAGRVPFPTDLAAAKAAITRARKGQQTVSLWPHEGGLTQVVSVPSSIGQELVGTVSVGFSLDEQAAARFKRLTNSEIAFAVDGRVEASTLPASFNQRLQTLVGASDVRTIDLGESDYVAVSRALPLVPPTGDAVAGLTPPIATVLILRSRTDRLRFLNDVHRELAVTAVLARSPARWARSPLRCG
jgi:hypothetical protein